MWVLCNVLPPVAASDTLLLAVPALQQLLSSCEHECRLAGLRIVAAVLQGTEAVQPSFQQGMQNFVLALLTDWHDDVAAAAVAVVHLLMPETSELSPPNVRLCFYLSLQ